MPDFLRWSISSASFSYCSMTIFLSESVSAEGSSGAQTTGSMLSSVKPRSSMALMSSRKSGLWWVKVPRI